MRAAVMHRVVEFAVHRLQLSLLTSSSDSGKPFSGVGFCTQGAKGCAGRRCSAHMMGGGGAAAGRGPLISGAPEVIPRPPMVSCLVGRIHLN